VTALGGTMRIQFLGNADEVAKVTKFDHRNVAV